MSVTIESFLPFVLPSVPGCTDPAAIEAIRTAAIEFCKQTDLVQRVSTYNIVAATQDYTVTVPSDMQLARVLGAAHEGTWLESAPPGEVESPTALTGATIGDAVLASGTPWAWFQKTPTAATISLYPVPDTAVTLGLTIKAAFYPTQSCTVVEDVLFNEYVFTIAAGAIARLMATPGMPFTSQLAPVYEKKFRAGTSAGNLHALHGKQTHNLRVRPRSFV